MFYNCIVVLRFVVQKGRAYDSLLEIIDTKTLLEKVIPRHATGVLWRGILFENKLYTIFQVIISGR